MELNGGHNRRSLTPELKRRSVSPGFRQKEIGALEIAAEQVSHISRLCKKAKAIRKLS